MRPTRETHHAYLWRKETKRKEEEAATGVEKKRRRGSRRSGGESEEFLFRSIINPDLLSPLPSFSTVTPHVDIILRSREKKKLLPQN